MAALSEVASLVQRYCSSAASVAEQSGARQALSERMQAPGKLSLLEIVRQKDAQLTSEDTSTRARAVLLLSEARAWLDVAAHRHLTRLSRPRAQLLPSADLATAASWATPVSLFFASKLSDWPTVRGALGGSLFLLRAAHPLPVLDSRAAGDLLSTLLRDVHTQSLAASDRLLVLECLTAAAETHPAAVQALERRALDGCIAAVDGEKDPRCLGLAFRLWPRLASLFPQDGAAMRACAEEMHDVLACYFPLVFNPPPGAPADKKHRQTRDALAADLAAALTCTPAFAPFAMPLLIGKLAVPTDHEAVAVEDTLSALQTAVQGFPPSVAATHAHSIWRGLRAVLLPSGNDQEDDGMSAGARRLRALAGDTLTLVLRILATTPGNHATQCVDEILADAVVTELCRLMLGADMATRTSPDASVRGCAAAAVSAIATLLAATARSSVNAACRVHTTVMPTVVAAIPQHGTGVPHREALVLAAHVTAAASEAACSTAAAAGDGGKRLGAPFGALAGATLQVFLSAAAVTADAHMADADDDELDDSTGDAMSALSTAALGVAGLKALLLVPAPFDALDEADRARAADALTSVALFGRDAAVNGDASAALAAVAEASDAGFALVTSTCMPRTLHAISSCTSADSCSAAMACVRTLAAARAHALAPKLAGALAERLQAQLPGAAHEAVQEVLLPQLRALETLCSTCAFPTCDTLTAFAAWALHSADQVPQLARPGVASAAGAAAAACGIQAQAMLAAASADAVLAEPVSGSSSLVAAHLLCALHPGQPVESIQSAAVAARLVQLAAMAADPGLEAVLLEAVASLVNKSADDVVAASLISGQLSPAALTVGVSSQAGDGALVARIKVAGHVASGLAWRGARGGMADLPALLLPLLRAHPLKHAPFVAAAALALAQPLEHCKVKNALTRPMTAQRYFTSVIQLLLAQLREGAGDARTGGILALAQVIRSAPRAPLMSMCPSLVPLLPECLALVASGTFRDAELLSSVLACTCDILVEESGRAAATDHAGAVVTSLCQLAVPSGATSAAVRVTALQGLIAAAELPYSKTYPYRKALLHVLGRAVDDPKKRVRSVAVAARTIWEAMPSA